MPIDNLPASAGDFTLEHVLGHEVSLSDFNGRDLVITFGGRDTADQIRQGIAAIRTRFGPDELPVISISDLRRVPRPARVIAKSMVKKAYEEAVKMQDAALQAAGKPLRETPDRDLIMLLDWSGRVSDQFGVSSADKEAAAIVVDAGGTVRGSGTGDELGDAILRVLAQRSPTR
jgi:AhpC/TSA family